MPEKFAVIVVGAGLAGLSAAYTLARMGVNVAVIERGEYPGAKNVMGGVIYRHPTEEVFPEFWTQAPLERPVVEQQLWVLSAEDAMKTGHRSGAWAAEHNACTVLRGKFDAWLGEQVAAAGGLIITGTTVTDVLRDTHGYAYGVRTSRPEGDLHADIVILADGVNSLLGEKLGLHPRWAPNEVALAVKQVLAPPGRADERAKLIESRFGLRAGEGLTIEMYGALTRGMVGTAFLYTNRDTLSFGVGALLSDYTEQRANPHALLEAARQHPALSPYLADCEPREYAAHLIPEGGYYAIPLLFANGLLVAGDAAQLCNGLHREGSNMAMISGKLAAETALEALVAGNFSAKVLRTYEQRLCESFIVKDLHKYRHATRHMERNRHFFTKYPEMANRMATEFLTVDGTPKREKQGRVLAMAGSKLRLASDLWRLFKVVK